MLRSGATLVLLPGPPTPCASQQPGTVMEVLLGSPWPGLNHCCSSPTPAGSVANSPAPSRLRAGRRADRKTGLTTAGVASRCGAPAVRRLRQARTTYKAGFCCITVLSMQVKERALAVDENRFPSAPPALRPTFRCAPLAYPRRGYLPREPRADSHLTNAHHLVERLKRVFGGRVFV